MLRRLGLSLLCLLLLGFSGVVGNQLRALPVWGQTAHQTVPSRTPTPGPTNTPNPGDNPPPPEDTATPIATATSTHIPVTLAATPAGGFLTTAVPCSGNPTILAVNTTNVRSGPGIDYEEIAELVYLEVRYIVARAEHAPWWLIQLEDGSEGWVADDVVEVQGYIGIVPIAEAPPLDGQTPTPGPTWNPTPLPTCTVTPVPSQTPTPIAEEVIVVEPVASDTPVPPTATFTATAVPPTETPVAPPTVATPAANPTLPATAVPLDPDPPQTSSTDWLLWGAGALLVIGTGIYLMRRRGSSAP